MNIITTQWNGKRLIAWCSVLCLSILWGASGVLAQETAPNQMVEREGEATPKFWTKGDVIGTILNDKGEVIGHNGRMLGPQNQTTDPATPEKIIVKAGALVKCSVEDATDPDHWTRDDPDGDGYGHDYGDASDDGVKYVWTGGDFKIGDNPDGTPILTAEAEGTTTTWIAPKIPGSYTISCTLDDTPTPVESPETGERDDDPVIRSVNVIVVKVEMINPTGDPAKEDEAAVDVNEFTFDGASPGVCRIVCAASITPDTPDTRAWALNAVTWQVNGITGTTVSWPNGNKGLNPICRLTGLPADNAGFGTKSVSMAVDEADMMPNHTTTRPIELFFGLEDDNHPGGNMTPANSGSDRAPNWFYYWVKTGAGDANALFNSQSEDGIAEVPAMLEWYFGHPYNDNEIWVNYGALGQAIRRDGSNQQVSGIDYFANVTNHEREHVSQIATANALLEETTGIWASGWSWNWTPNNHNNPGPPRVGLDADNDDMPNSIDPQPNVYDSLAVERSARMQENIAENTYQAQDNADAGKQHLTIDWED